MSQTTSLPTIDPEVSGAEPAKKIEGRTPWQIFWNIFKRDKVSIAGGIFLIFLIGMAFGAPLFATFVAHHPAGAIHSDLTDAYGNPALGPSKAYWGGVDQLGRDVFVRTLYGARTSLTVAFASTGISVVIGIVLGLMAGYYGGWVDTLISRLIDIVLSLPLLILAIGLAAACNFSPNGCLGGLLQPGLSLVIAIIALFGWPYVARIVRGQTLSIREREFIEAARATGFGGAHIMFLEILPNLVAPIVVVLTFLVPQNIIFESSLSYLGVGIPASTPSWGRMISDAVNGDLYLIAWWLLLFPGVCLVLTTLAFNLLGDGLRDALDPRAGR
jgi:peptide/nickel transport system permease protein